MPPKAASSTDFDEVFASLKKISAKYEKHFTVKTDDDTIYTTETKSPSFNGKPAMFVYITKKSYVAFHFFPVYLFPDLIQSISPELKKRMQGKTCWNFKKPDETLVNELAGVVEAGYQRFKSEGYL